MDKALADMINEYIEKGDFTGGTSDSNIAEAERKLEVKFPAEYKEFVRDFGSGGICGVDILGVERSDYASVVESTERYRELGLPKRYIVVETVDEFVYCLSTVNEYNVVRWDDVTKKESSRYSSFNNFFTR